MPHNESTIKAKQKFAELLKKRKGEPSKIKRVPPGQHLTEGFPGLVF